jgi:hypothetical protein
MLGERSNWYASNMELHALVFPCLPRIVSSLLWNKIWLQSELFSCMNDFTKLSVGSNGKKTRLGNVDRPNTTTCSFYYSPGTLNWRIFSKKYIQTHIYIYIYHIFSNLIRTLFVVSEGYKIRCGLESRAD